MTKAYFFDAFGTLFDLDIPAAKINELANGHGSILLSIWRRKQLEYTWLKTLMGDYLPFNEITRHALQFAMNSVGATDEKLVDILLPIYESPKCFSDVRILLQGLNQIGMKTAILSNGTLPMLQAGVKNTNLGLLLDHILSVDEIKVYKPSPEVYQMALDAFKLKKEEAIFVSSNQWDIAGASCFGLSTIWVNRKKEPVEQLGHQADRVIHSLAEIIL